MSHFEPYRAMGKGGFGRVSLVKHKASGVLMAVKTVKKGPCVDSEHRLRSLWIERRILALLDNPFVVYMIYAFQDDDNCYMVLPWLSGGDLKYYLKKKKRMTEERCQFYAAELILGLQHLHDIHIVHRDLKPSNLLFDGDGHLHIIDFGVADRLRKSRKQTLSERAGTKIYMSPEQLLKKEYSFSADIWSLGATLCELMTGKKPFKNKDHILNHKPRYARELSKHAKSLLKGLLKKDASERLGCGRNGLKEIKEHPFFKGVNWRARYNKEVEPPYKPPENQANCDPREMMEELLAVPTGDSKPRKLTDLEQKKFANFEFNAHIDTPPLRPAHRRKMLRKMQEESYSLSLSKTMVIRPGETEFMKPEVKDLSSMSNMSYQSDISDFRISNLTR
eukprot:142613_1